VSAASRLAGYGVSLALVAAVVVLRWFVVPAWSLAHPYLLFYPAIIAAGWYGGFGPGVVATPLAALALSYLLNEARVRAERRARDAEAAARRAKEQH